MKKDADSGDEISADGRRARRERGRIAVIDAVFELMTEQAGRPSVEQLAERSGVSVSSIFRYFGSLDDLQWQSFNRFFERFKHVFEIPQLGEGSFDERVDRFVAARVAMHEQTAAIIDVARAKAREHKQLAVAIDRGHVMHAQQIETQFAEELERFRADDGSLGPDGWSIVSVLATVTSTSSWMTLTGGQQLSADEIARAWTMAIPALLAASPPD